MFISPMRPSKYRNTIVTKGKKKAGDSIKEVKRENDLKLMEKSGLISHLESQKKFIVFNGFRTTQYWRYELGEKKITTRGKTTRNKDIFCQDELKIRDITYVADFYYFDCKLDKWIIEDVKGFRTKEFELKLKMMLEILKEKPDHVFFCNDNGFKKYIKE